MESDISSSIGAQTVQRAQQEAAFGGRDIPLTIVGGTATNEGAVNAPTGWRAQLGRVKWHHIAIVVGVALVAWWLLTGEDPVETVGDVAKGVGDAAKGAAEAVTG